MSNAYFDKNVFGNKKAFIPFITAGYPNLALTEEFIMQMVKGGCDLVEIGIPFSDPVAEGPVIQNASTKALEAGVTLDKIFEMTESLRKKTGIPLVYMTYINPVFKYGYDNFFAVCDKLNVRGIIVPDLPYEEKEEVNEFAKKYDVEIISLIAPTSNDRIETIAKSAKGFIYVVSSLGVTGVRSEITTDLSSIIDIIRQTTTTKAAVGFGINTPSQAKEISKFADGVIVGSAIIKIIDEHKENAGKYIFEYTKQMKEAMEA